MGRWYGNGYGHWYGHRYCCGQLPAIPRLFFNLPDILPNCFHISVRICLGSVYKQPVVLNIQYSSLSGIKFLSLL